MSYSNTIPPSRARQLQQGQRQPQQYTPSVAHRQENAQQLTTMQDYHVDDGRAPNRDEIARALQARLPATPAERGLSRPLSQEESEKLKETKKKILKILDQKIFRTTMKDSAQALDAILLIIRNITSNPDDPKYRKIKAAAFRKKAGKHADSAIEILQAMGFMPFVVEHEENYVYNEPPEVLPELHQIDLLLSAYDHNIHDKLENSPTALTKKQQEEIEREKILKKIEEDKAARQGKKWV
eukprot:TRINITY_DN19634_c0_g1::TRINITY_DN19634_c0_g1_i1::g.3346::m.3346 TRINITY_DN19634_c0_g1::TRINITY_DN19634_c0_g1_i1::g.3346  ORF type:complete len:240 (-),score=45.58,PUB/PF09409.5/1.6e-09,DUF2088/PF09861.4/0.031,hDGE_amylase/PF14701.1/0.088,hDGE_amylase/PF14701.1/1.1e+03 TRINITY_DN19634_c0_g1_i1:61-780(-)